MSKVVEFVDLLPFNYNRVFTPWACSDHDGYNKRKAERKSRFTVLGSRLAAGVRDRGSGL
jgi:hypothetical protein